MRSSENSPLRTISEHREKAAAQEVHGTSNKYEETHPFIIMSVFLNRHFFTDEEYRILYEVFAQKKTLEEISGGDDSRCGRLKQVLDGALARMAQRLQLPLNEETRGKIGETLERQKADR